MSLPGIRSSTPDDLAAIYSLYPAAFPGEDLLPLLHDLLPDTERVLSLMAEVDANVVGHIAFTRCGIEGDDTALAMLAPLAVSPAWQRAGVGSALTTAGLKMLKAEGSAAVLVLGDPAYYGRFGFKAPTLISPPYPLPTEYEGAWQSLRLDPGASAISGSLVLPEYWRRPKLWLP